MATVSGHLYIVTIYRTGVSSDRRPYLVMEYYPSPNFGVRVKQGPMRVSKVLEVGIKLASAVETAHRAGVIHRDIKPANILVSGFDQPGLTDFGISAARTDSSIPHESFGFSPPYAPNEIILDEEPGNARSDIFSLGATLWAVLAGHSPFEIPGQDNSRAAVMSRVLDGTIPPLNRPDVPPALEFALQHALSKDPKRRPASAEALAIMLQSVERVLGPDVTPISLAYEDDGSERTGRHAGPEVEAGAAPPTQIGRTRVVSLDTAPRPAVPSNPGFQEVQPEVLTVIRNRGGQSTDQSDTFVPVSARSVSAPVEAEATSVRSHRSTAIAAGVVGVVILVIGIIALSGGGKGTPSSQNTTPPVLEQPVLLSPAPVEAVTGLRGVVSNSQVTFTWNDATDDGVRYLVSQVGAAGDPQVVTQPEFVVDGQNACIEVVAFIPGQTEAAGVQGCAP